MVHLPSTLELEHLSYSEIMDNMLDVVQVINEKKRSYDDDRDEQELFAALKTECKRREEISAVNALSA